MKKSLYWLLKGICYLEMSTLVIIAILVTIDAVIAKPLCYLVDANGRSVNLSFVCQQSNRTVKPTTPTANTPPAPMPNQTPPDNGDTTKPEEEVNPSPSDTDDRKIPLLDN